MSQISSEREGIQPGSQVLRHPTANGTIEFLDGIRGLAVLIVMISHYGFRKVVPGGLGVTIFFFLSGFLITTLLLRETRDTGTIRIGQFYVRRFLRLCPELYMYLLVSGVGGVLYIGLARIRDYAAAVFYYMNYYTYYTTIYSIDLRWGHLWSLAVEEHYYITYPLLMITLWRKPKALMAALFGICMMSLALRSLYYGMGLHNSYNYLATETRLDCIAYGCLTGLVVWHYPEAIRRLGRWLVLAFFAGLGAIALSVVVREGYFRECLRYSAQCLGLCGIFVALYFVPEIQRRMRFLDSAVMQWSGRLSYGAYIWHVEAVLIFRAMTGLDVDTLPVPMRLAFMVVSCLLSFGVAYLSYRLVFRNVAGFRLKFGSHAA
jgi:peptidoglycan/LPS O-acetylase OafA/YrhL